MLIERSAQEPAAALPEGSDKTASSFRHRWRHRRAGYRRWRRDCHKTKSGWAFRSRRPHYVDEDAAPRTRDADGKEDLALWRRACSSALPPRLLESSVAFTPAPATRALWRATPTWMAPHAKSSWRSMTSPFWRGQGLSGSGTETRWGGRWWEIHDASAISGKRQRCSGIVLCLATWRGNRSARRRGGSLRCASWSELFGPGAGGSAATYFADLAADPLHRDGGRP